MCGKISRLWCWRAEIEALNDFHTRLSRTFRVFYVRCIGGYYGFCCIQTGIDVFIVPSSIQFNTLRPTVKTEVSCALAVL